MFFSIVFHCLHFVGGKTRDDLFNGLRMCLLNDHLADVSHAYWFVFLLALAIAAALQKTHAKCARMLLFIIVFMIGLYNAYGNLQL